MAHNRSIPTESKKMNTKNFKHEALSTINLCGKQIAKVEGYSELLLDADIIEFEILVQMTKSSVEEVKLSVSKRIEYIIYIVKTCNTQDENPVKVRQMLSKEGSDFRLIEEVFIFCSDLKTYEDISNILTEKLDGSVRISSPRQRHSSNSLQQARERAVQLSVENACRKASQMARVSAQEVGMALYLEEIECSQEDNNQSVIEFSDNLHRKLATNPSHSVLHTGVHSSKDSTPTDGNINISALSTADENKHSTSEDKMSGLCASCESSKDYFNHQISLQRRAKADENSHDPKAPNRQIDLSR